MADQHTSTKKRKSSPEPTTVDPTPEDVGQKRAKANGAERPAPLEAKFACVKKEDVPKYNSQKEGYVTSMCYSLEDVAKTSIKDSGLGIGPVCEPFQVIGRDLSHKRCYYYTGFTNNVLFIQDDEYDDSNLKVCWTVERSYGNSVTHTITRRFIPIPEGDGEAFWGKWWLKGTFVNGKAHGLCTVGHKENKMQYVGTMKAGRFDGRVEGYNGAGTLELFRTYVNGLREGPAEEQNMGGQRIHGVGSYHNDKKNGKWEITEADGKRYTTHYDNDVEVMEKRTEPVYLKPLPPPPEVDADGNPKTYTVDEVLELANEEEKALSRAPPKSQTPREQAFVNALSRELQKAGVIVTHEIKAGRGKEAVDFKFSRAEFGVLCAVKVFGKDLSKNSGDLSHYRHWLRKNNPEIGRLAKEDKLIAVNVMLTEPKKENVEAAEEDMDQFVWTPSKGKLLDYIDGVIADKQKSAVAA